MGQPNLISQTGLYLWRQRPKFILSEAEGLPHTWRVQSAWGTIALVGGMADEES